MIEQAGWYAAFVVVLESLGGGSRLQRGRRDARAGHVRSLTISTSLVVAQVRAPDEPAQRARIAVRAFGAAEWGRIEAALAGQARYVADLLAGRMPADIEELFAGLGLRLLPDSVDEVAMDCTCQRWAMPCAHLTAAWYALARSFETDPFGAFAWRGRNRDELLDGLRRLRAAQPGPPAAAGAPAADRDPADGGDPAAFWGARVPAPATGSGGYVTGAVRRPDALLDQLEPLPISCAGQPVTELLRPAYRAFAQDDD